MRTRIALLAGLMALAVPAGAQTRDAPVKPMEPGAKPRPALWNNDGAPPPPAMWRGHGGDLWPTHYKACRQRYRSYDHRTDTYRRDGRRVRCTL